MPKINFYLDTDRLKLKYIPNVKLMSYPEFSFIFRQVRKLFKRKMVFVFKDA
jgi:hypothetical protein